jgi:glutamine---fructose-6-phosphate transaminase (isomerizing)
MCGIVGCIRKDKVKQKLIKMLKKLEYRGYDSSGIAYFNNNSIEVIKKLGQIKELENFIDFKNDSYSIGIGHTRWATTGIPNEANAHPHLSNDKSIAIVHNGIIKNYEELKDKLIKDGFKFYSQTDTEVIANLLQKNMSENNDIIKSLSKLNSMLNGSYALACLFNKDKNSIYVIKNESPLYIGSSKNKKLISSDVINLDTKYYYNMENFEIAKIDIKDIIFYDKYGKVIKKHKIINNFNEKEISKGHYSNFMIKEINEIYDSLIKTTSYYLSPNNNLIKLPKNLLRLKFIEIIACGTAYHSGLMAQTFFENICKIKTRVSYASEFVNDSLINKNTLYIFISQSGETADTLLALKKVKDKGIKTLAITNVLTSTISRVANYVLPLFAGREIAVASTKAYNNQILVCYILANYINSFKLKNIFNLNDFKNNLENNKKKIIKLIKRKNEKNISNKILEYKNIFFIGKGKDFVSAQEGSLKLKEITYINCSAFPSGELKHGTLALIDNQTLVIVFLTDKENIDSIQASINEIKSRGGKIMLISCFKIKNYDYYLSIPNIESYNDFISIIPAQKIAYYVSKLKNINPDKPRNLAKSVTVI